jgi:glutamyl-tRNA reductase
VKILLLGMNHRTASLDLRERHAVDDVRSPLSKLVAEKDIEEAVLVSTCNRVEVVVTTRYPDAARIRLRSFIARDLATGDQAIDGSALDEALYEYSEASAVRHVLRVASSVDSLVVGEPQILGQVKDAYRAAVECGACGPILSRLFQRAFSTAKRVRNETRIAERPVSVAAVAVKMAEQIFESLHDKFALMIGAGEMIQLALETLRDRGLAGIRIANRTPARAENLASHFDASAHGLSELPLLLPRSDIVLTCIAGSDPIMTVESISPVLRARRGRPIFVIDIGVPRNVDPAVNDLDNVYLYDLDDMTAVADSNAEERRGEVVHAEAIILEEALRRVAGGSQCGADHPPPEGARRGRAGSRARSDALAPSPGRVAAGGGGCAHARDREQDPPRTDVPASQGGGSRGGAGLPGSGAPAVRPGRRRRAGRRGRHRARGRERRVMSKLRIATRGSQLALAQSGFVARRIEESLGVETELVEIRTTGDRIENVSLAKIGGKGLFIKEIEEALLEGRADLAIHSAKDLPAAIAPGLTLAAFPERADPRDALIGHGPGARLEELPRGARVGTGSLRRGSQLRAIRPDLEVIPLRGNVDTRLRKLEEEGLHAVILACAGLDRLGLGDRVHQRVSPTLLLPSVGQGTLAIEAGTRGRPGR